MAIDPATLKIIVSQAIKVISDEEKRNTAILSIIVLVVLLFSIILIPIYLLTNPIEAIKMFMSGDLELNLVQELKTDYPVNLEYGELTYKGKFPFPIEQADKVIVTSIYGTRIHPIKGNVSKHTGIDLSGVHHDNILAIANGEVTFAGVQSGYGNCIEIKHNIEGEEFYSFYAHLSRIDVVMWQQVEQGNIIALEGGDPNTDPNTGTSTGHHLHFEIRVKSGYGNDIDPTPYILDI